MSVRNRFGRRVALFALAFFIPSISSIAYGEGAVQRSIPGETVTRPIYTSSCDNHWASAMRKSGLHPERQYTQPLEIPWVL